MFQLNSEQQLALQKINVFLANSNLRSKMFSLVGPPGSGKTTIIKTLFSDDIYDKKHIALSATTNKAVSVIENMFISSHLGNKKNIDFMTIHKLCKIKRHIDNDGNQYFNLDENPKYIKSPKSIYMYDIIVIDEASMVNQELFNLLTTLSKKIPGKIIFVGDNYQLPPINENISLVFRNVFDRYTLNKVERFDSNILELTNRIRYAIRDKTKVSLKNVKANNLCAYKNFNDWVGDYIKNFNENNIFLAYTNNRCNYINNISRKVYFKNLEEKTKTSINLDQEFLPNEYIVFNNYYECPNLDIQNSSNDSSISLNSSGHKFYTSFKGIIDNCYTSQYTINHFPLKALINLKMNLSEVNKYSKLEKEQITQLDDDTCPICYEKMNSEESILQTECQHNFCEACLKVWLEKSNTCPFCRMSLVGNTITINSDSILTKKLNDFVVLTEKKVYKIWNISLKKEPGTILKIHRDDINNFQEHLEQVKAKIHDIKDYIIKNKRRQDNLFIIRRLWEYFYFNYFDLFADINYGYCITVHKSQGSTFDSVYLDTKNILASNSEHGHNLKCFYTGASRGAKRLVLLL